MALDASIGGIASNSYCTVAEGDAYFADRLYATSWTGATAGAKAQALIMATARLDEEDFAGDRASETQALKWPREDAEVDEVEILSTVIPVQVKAATFKLALSFLVSNISAPTGLENFKSLSVGPISLEMNQPVTSDLLPPDVAKTLRGLRLYAVLA